MLHVFVETNWVVEYAAPAYVQRPEALLLLNRAKSDDLHLHVPGICLGEAPNAIRRRFQPRSEADNVRKFLKWGRHNNRITSVDDQTVRKILDQMESQTRTELEDAEATLVELWNLPGLEIFGFSEQMIEKSQALSRLDLGLEPFDQSILAAILVRAEHLRAAGNVELAFCELDGDLQPWDKHRNDKRQLKDLYDPACIWVYSDFALQSPPRPENWPMP